MTISRLINICCKDNLLFPDVCEIGGSFCQNGGTCQWDPITNKALCLCSKFYQGSICQTRSGKSYVTIKMCFLYFQYFLVIYSVLISIPSGCYMFHEASVSVSVSVLSKRL